MALLWKCLVASLIMIGIDWVSKTPNYFLAGLMLSFPCLSMIAYYFIDHEYGVAQVSTTTTFALASVLEWQCGLPLPAGLP